jgi:hypothetical protein
VQEHSPPETTIFRLADLPISRFDDKIRLGRSLALPSRITLYALRSHPFRSFHGIIATNEMVRSAMFGAGCDVLSAG